MARAGRSRRGSALRLTTAAVGLAAAACLYEPPRHLPSSVRLLYSRTTRDSLGTKVDIYFLVAREGNELRLTGEQGDDRQPSFAPSLRRAFFTRAVDGREEIWSVDLDGSREEVVLSAPGFDVCDPAVSPDGTRIAYTRTAAGRQEVWIAGVDGSDPQPLVAEAGPWREPAWSPDGRTIAVVAGADAASRIHLVSPEGGAPRPLAAAETAPQSEPAWSPDGTRIAFVRGRGERAEIAVATVAAGGITRLTENDVADLSPVWSPDGERIAFVSQRPHGRENLWLMDADGRNAQSLTRHERSDARDPSWL